MRPLQSCRLTLLMGCALSMAVVAAPTTENAPAAESSPVSTLTLGAAAGVRPGERNSDARTIDLLVDMQQPSVGIQFNERSNRNTAARDGQARAAQGAQTAQTARPGAMPVASPGTRPQVEALATPSSGLFGSGATPAVHVRSQSGSDSPSGSDPGPGSKAARPQSELPPELKRWLHWPRQVVEYVRQNRTLVFGCTAMLLVMAWTGSMMFSRRRG
jgi:hypothetical protein